MMRFDNDNPIHPSICSELFGNGTLERITVIIKSRLEIIIILLADRQ